MTVCQKGTMPKGSMPKDCMPNDIMPNDSMPIDSMPKGSMPKSSMPKGSMPNDCMPIYCPAFLTLDKIFILYNFSFVQGKKYFVRAEGRGTRHDFCPWLKGRFLVYKCLCLLLGQNMFCPRQNEFCLRQKNIVHGKNYLYKTKYFVHG